MACTHAQWLAAAAARLVSAGLDDSPRLDAELILAHAAGVSRARLIAERSAALPPDTARRADALLARREAREPVAYLTGRKEFWGLDLAVAPGVLVPRPDTETLVEAALESASLPAAARALDACTGSGAVALALKHARPGWRLDATDVHEVPLATARANGARLGLEVAWHQADLWPPVTAPFNLIVANPPYLAPDDPHLPALVAEPRAALVADDKGLALLARLAAEAPARLAPGGWLWLEHGSTQGAAVRERLAGAGFARVATRRDLGGHERVTGGQRGSD